MFLNKLNTFWYSFMSHSVAIIKNVVAMYVTVVHNILLTAKSKLQNNVKRKIL